MCHMCDRSFPNTGFYLEPLSRLERLGLVRRIDGGVEGCRYVAKPLAHAARTLRHRTVASAGAIPYRDPTPTLT